MSLRIRQIVFAARDLATTVARFEAELGLRVAYRDPLVAEFGLHNALMCIGDQFLEVVSPLRDDTAASRHIARHGDSSYMLILQTDDLNADRARLAALGIRVIWQSDYADMRSVHLHPKDLGAAIVSLDEATPPESWRWAGPSWQRFVSADAPREIVEVTIGAVDPDTLARRWAEVLGTPLAAGGQRIELQRGALRFTRNDRDLILGYRLARSDAAPEAQVLSICGAQFELPA